MNEKIKTWPPRFSAKEKTNMEKALFDWPVVLQYDVKAKYLESSRAYTHLYPFDKPIKTLYFRSFVVYVLFGRFHFKVIRKSPYLQGRSKLSCLIYMFLTVFWMIFTVCLNDFAFRTFIFSRLSPFFTCSAPNIYTFFTLTFKIL